MKYRPYEISARWGPRAEDANKCGERLGKMLEALAAAHPCFARWYRKGMSRAAANKPFCAMPPRTEELAKIFQRNIFYRGHPRGGYWPSAWNGQDDPYGASLSAFVGQAGDSTNALPNSVEIMTTSPKPGNADLTNVAVMKAVLMGIVSAWEPDWGSVGHFAIGERWADAQRHYPYFCAGWITYLPDRYARLITPPSSAIVEQVRGGMLLSSTEEPFTFDNPEHAAAADAIQASFAPIQALPQPDPDFKLVP